jgi:hypothetical protein
MGLRDTVRNATVAGIAAIGDLAKVEAVTYKQLVDAEYNVALGETVTNRSVYVNVTVTMMDFDRRLVDGVNIRPTDQRALIAGASIDFVPESGGDVMEFTNEQNRLEIWEVIEVKVDTAGALYDMQVRKIA